MTGTSSPIKIVLLNPPYTNFEGLKESGGHLLPLGLAYLASYLRSKLACRIFIIDAEAEGLNYQKIKARIQELQPQVIGITCPTPTMDHVFKIAEMIKKEIAADLLMVAGGIHPTALPEETVKNEYIDFVVKGEGEITFYELIKAIAEGQTDFSSIPGLYFKKNGQVVATLPRLPIANLDDIPFPARDLFKLELYRSAPTKKVSDDPSGPLLTSRGCAFGCVHCISQCLWGRMIRFRSTENVIKEIEECLEKFGIKEFNFFDDTFTLKEDRALAICQKIVDKGFNISWVSFSRVNTITEKLVALMKAAGCKKISFGLESGSQEILDLMQKNATIEMGKQAVLMVARAGIFVHASFMFGNLGETEATIKQTIAFAKSLPLDNATFFITSPFPGTELYQVAKKEGFITPATKWSDFAPLTNTSPILVQHNVPKDRLVYWQKRAFKEFYLRPKYLFFKIKQLTSVDAFKTILEGLRILYRIMLKKAS